MSESTELVERLTSDFREYLEGSLPRIAQGLETMRDASFSATVQFRARKKGQEVIGYQAVFRPRERVPLDEREYEIKLEDGQLSLFG